MTRANDIASFGDEIENNEVALSTTIPTDVSDLTDSTSLLSSGSGVTAYANVDVLPLSGEANGALGYVESTNRLYMFNGTGWYSIALINQSPTIDANTYQATYTLDTAGANTVVELVATDPEGIPITWSYTANNLGNTATISQSSNVFTITPSTLEADIGTFSITFKASDGVNIGTASSEFTLTFVSPYWKNVALLTGTNDTNGLQNDSFVDRSTNGYTITPAGDPTQTSFHPYLDNWSVEFDGSGDIINFPSNDIILSGDFTISAWVYLRGSSSAQIIANRGPSFVDNRQVKINTNNRIGLYDGSSELTSTGTITRNKWHYIEVTRSGTTITFFIDGSSAGTATTSSTFSFGSIGALWQTYDFWNGYISNLRVTTSSISNSSVPTEKLTAIANTVLLTCQSNRFIDNSSSAHTLTPAGNVTVKSFNPFGQNSVYTPGENKGSAYFDGTGGSYLKSSTEAVFGFGTDNFTIECWYYPVSKVQNYPRIWHFGNYWQDSSALAFLDRHNDYSSIFSVASYSLGYILQSTTTVTNNVWYHLAVVRNGSTITLYVNGIAEDTYNIGTSEFITSSSNFLSIGNVSDGSNLSESETNAYISDLKYIKGTAVYTSDFTPPTSPVGNTNASLYLPMDNAGIFDQTGNQTLTLVGDVQTSTTQTKYATTSMYFDGTGDYINTNNNLHGNFGTGNFTVEAWVYLNESIGTNRAIFGSGTSDSDDEFTLLLLSTGEFYFDWGGASTYIQQSGATFTANAWHHVAITRSGTQLDVWLDGTSVVSNSSHSFNYTGTSTFKIGMARNGTFVWNGYIEDLQILKGQAKYTSNFTPPTSSLSRLNQ